VVGCRSSFYYNRQIVLNKFWAQAVKKSVDSSEERLHEILGQVRSEKVKKILTAHFNDTSDTL
jgi:hypothetical protein